MTGDETDRDTTGEIALEPIGVIGGEFVFPIFGFDPEGDDDDDSDDEDSTGADDQDDDEDDEDSDDDDSDDEDDDEDDSETALWKKRAETYKRRMKAADERATRAERENRRLKRTKKDALEGPDKEEFEEAKTARATAESVALRLRLQVALLSDKTYDWHDPEMVIRSLEGSDDVEVDEDGKVTGVKQALKRLAKAKPYLVKKADRSDDSDEDEDEDAEDTTAARQTPKQRTGSPARRRRGPTVPDRKSLQAKYTILQGR